MEKRLLTKAGIEMSHDCLIIDYILRTLERKWKETIEVNSLPSEIKTPTKYIELKICCIGEFLSPKIAAFFTIKKDPKPNTIYLIVTLRMDSADYWLIPADMLHDKPLVARILVENDRFFLMGQDITHLHTNMSSRRIKELHCKCNKCQRWNICPADLA